jgi:hypothetical protein
MELADYFFEADKKRIVGRGKADQRLLKVWEIAIRETVVGAFQHKAADLRRGLLVP